MPRTCLAVCPRVPRLAQAHCCPIHCLARPAVVAHFALTWQLFCRGTPRKEKKRGGINSGTGLAHAFAQTAMLELGRGCSSEPPMHPLAGDSGHVPAPALPKTFLGQLSPSIPLHLLDASMLGWEFLPSSKVNSLLAFSTSAEACWEPNILAALPLGEWRPAAGETGHHRPVRDRESPHWLQRAQDHSITCKGRASKTSV